MVFSVQTGWGGTSFAAPQFNGVTALFDQAVRQRVGLLNFALYDLVRFGSAYRSSEAPLRDIAAGDNWLYRAPDMASGRRAATLRRAPPPRCASSVIILRERFW